MLTFGDYWTEITYMLVITFLTFAAMISLVFRYPKIIRAEFTQFLRSNASLYVGVFLTAVSAAFILEATNIADHNLNYIISDRPRPYCCIFRSTTQDKILV